ncbi:type I-E CRISPR-associated protein Cas5/CasD [Sphaerotilus mobilis]|uniref:CRISPR-associated Cas5e family protein n=1 Tax=Sphaerotilus mobilis TaxID=47994 RepID=A0A4Q7LHR7_9BURK|nr:type I-E CRISPR-associated protein Cas5/CasD [Sphaerotilus mobilis]RZS52988.1 CRISPR-associated Cas5e family protein [Sphaerotilus mobilis]
MPEVTTTLLLRLVGPLQAWGTTSRFDERDTQLEPSKSGVLGLVCAALGRDRAESVHDLAALKMGVRVDREGLLMRDYQTAAGVLIAATGKADLGRTVVSPRYYLADAAFLVGLQGDDSGLLRQVSAALRAPRWPLALGRKAMVPGLPVWLPDDLQAGDLVTTLASHPRIAPPRFEHRGQPVRLMLEHPDSGALRHDQPVAPYAARRFGPRFVLPGVLDHVPEPAALEPR